MSPDTRPAIFFDALGTLFDLTPPQVIFSRVLSALGRELGEEEAARLLSRANRWWLDPSRPPSRTTEEELDERRVYVRLFMEEYGHARDAALAEQLEEQAYWARWAQPFSDAEPVLQELQPEYRLAVLSNGGPSSLDAVRYAGLGGYFEQMYAGLELGAQKPDARAYELAAQRLGVSMQDSWLVDDTAANAEGGMNAGMRVVFLSRQGGSPGDSAPTIASLAELPKLLKTYMR